MATCVEKSVPKNVALAKNQEFILAKIAQLCTKEPAADLVPCPAMSSCRVDILAEVLVALATEVFCTKNARERAGGRLCAGIFATSRATKFARLAIKNARSAAFTQNAIIPAGKYAFHAWKNVLNEDAGTYAQAEIAITKRARFRARRFDRAGTNVSLCSTIRIAQSFIRQKTARNA